MEAKLTDRQRAALNRQMILLAGVLARIPDDDVPNGVVATVEDAVGEFYEVSVRRVKGNSFGQLYMREAKRYRELRDAAKAFWNRMLTFRDGEMTPLSRTREGHKLKTTLGKNYEFPPEPQYPPAAFAVLERTMKELDDEDGD